MNQAAPAVERHRASPLRTRGWVATLSSCAALLIGLQVLFLGLNLVAATVPEQRIAQMLVDDLDTGAYPDTNYRPNGVGGRFDLFTDCVVAGTGIGRPDIGAVERSLLMPRITPCVGGEEVIPLIARGEYVTPGNYLRYWAGYTIVTKPALAFGGMDAMRAISGAILAAGVASFLIVGIRGLGIWSSVLLIVPLLMSADLAVLPSGSALHSMLIGVAFAGAGLVLAATRHADRAVVLAALTAGSVYCFFDLLSNPPLAWLLVTALATAGGFVAAGAARALRLGVISAAAWMAGFALTWVFRWVVGALVFGLDELREQVGGKVTERLSGEHKNVSSALGAGLVKNLRTWSEMPLTGVVAAVGAVAIVALIALAARTQGAKALAAWMLLVLPVAIVPVWYEVLSNHSQIHSFFTYRAVPVAVGWAIAAAALVARLSRIGWPMTGETRSGAVRLTQVRPS